MAFPTTTPARRRRSAPTTGRSARRVLAAATTTLALVGLAACSGSPEPKVPAPITETPTIEPSRTVPPEPDVPVVWPLTGVETDKVAERPALAVKIENTSAARPQSGLDQADVVWETIVEFEVSRLIAVFHSTVPDEVGPIRSVRPMDPTIVRPLNGLLAYSGGQPGILSEVQGSGVQSLSHDAGAPGMYRVGFRTAPHNVYGKPSTFWSAADGKHSAAPGEQFRFARAADQATAVVDGKAAKNLVFRLSAQSRPSWVWSSKAKAWLRSEGGAKATTPDGTQLRATNVVSITAAHPATKYKAQGGSRVPTYELVGKGSAVVATGGRTVKATWQKEGRDKPLRLVDKAGDPVLLAPGNTWVELVPKGKGSLDVS